ncbi:Glutathione synthetase [Talaromyces pinophilus]|nr:Glutathione synthetase [Talaromyces pinophilus]
MTESIYSTYPPKLSETQEQFLVSTIKDWTIQHGLTVRPPATFVSQDAVSKGVLATNAPVTLFPSPFPKACFEEARAVQKVYNELYARITSDEKWLGEVIEELIDVDDFVAGLWKVHQAVSKEGYLQDLSVGLFRSDYMVHTLGSETASLKQVEFNTISSSFGGLSCRVAALHTELLQSPPGHSLSYPGHPLLDGRVPPENTAVETLSAGLAAAHEAYGPSKSSPALPLGILFVVQEGERNIFDQLALSTRLTQFHKIPVFRLVTSEILDRTSIAEANPSRPLIYTPPHAQGTPFEITTVYLRSFYAPTDYKTDRDWSARLQLERSAAIKCPTVLNQLSGCKKIQQVLADPNKPDYLARFVPTAESEGTQEKLRKTFAPQYDLSPNGRGRELALNPETAARHVLKPQREGGGNNVYKEAIPEFLKSIPESDWKGYVLMELIQPPSEASNVVLRSDGEVVSGNVVGELGIFGTILWKSNGEILHNEEGGWLMRTKGKESNEGGVAAGFSSLDSIILY